MQDLTGKKCPKGELRCRAQLLCAKTIWLLCIRDWKASGKEGLDDSRICNRSWTLSSRSLLGIRALTTALTLRVKCLLHSRAEIVQTEMFCFECSLGSLRTVSKPEWHHSLSLLETWWHKYICRSWFCWRICFHPIPCRSQSGNKYWWLYPSGNLKISSLNVHLLRQWSTELWRRLRCNLTEGIIKWVILPFFYH